LCRFFEEKTMKKEKKAEKIEEKKYA